MVTTFLNTAFGATTPVATAPVETGATGGGGAITVIVAASGLLVACARMFLRMTPIGYVHAFAGATVVTLYFPGESSFAVREVPSILTATLVSPGSASTVIAIPVPLWTSSPGFTEVLK